jgi:hypothetical protein
LVRLCHDRIIDVSITGARVAGFLDEVALEVSPNVAARFADITAGLGKRGYSDTSIPRDRGCNRMRMMQAVRIAVPPDAHPAGTRVP